MARDIRTPPVPVIFCSVPAKRPPAGSYLPALHLQEGGFGLKTGFDNAKYIQLQKQHIQERISQFSGKLYLEFGG